MHMAADHPGTTFLAPADPTRRAMLARLISGETSVTKLAKPFKMTLPGISKHLKTLDRAGLIARGRYTRVAALPPGGRTCEDVAD